MSSGGLVNVMVKPAMEFQLLLFFPLCKWEMKLDFQCFFTYVRSSLSCLLPFVFSQLGAVA